MPSLAQGILSGLQFRGSAIVGARAHLAGLYSQDVKAGIGVKPEYETLG
jgi:hypothetical protein